MINSIKGNTISEANVKKKLNELNKIKKVEIKGKRLIEIQKILLSLFDNFLKTIFNKTVNESNSTTKNETVNESNGSTKNESKSDNKTDNENKTVHESKSDNKNDNDSDNYREKENENESKNEIKNKHTMIK